MTMKVLVTGAAGRIGSVVAHHLMDAGFDVLGTDIRMAADARVPMVIESLLDSMACYRLLKGIDAVVHIANHPNAGSTNPQRVFGENCTMNGNLLQAAHEMGVNRVIFTSTIQTVIGRSNSWDGPAVPCQLPYLPIDGAMPTNPANLYAASKVATEQVIEMFCRYHGMNAVVLRLPYMSISRERDRFLRRRSSTDVWGQTEAFTFLSVSDAATLMACILRRGFTGYQVHLPADASTTIGMSAREAYEAHLSHVPLRVPLSSLEALADASALERNFGWVQPNHSRTDDPAPRETGARSTAAAGN